MRKLKESYWNKFIQLDIKQKFKRNGILFEDLVECLLKIKYGCEWIRTSKSHDNNRDFYLTTSEFSYWAECKNYKDVIALDTIAPTLVMAQIFEVNKIIFFSYSDINSSAKNKIFSFGEKTHKKIDIFSGNTLDELIIESSKFLPEKFQPNEEDINSIGCPVPLEYKFYFIQTPILGVNIDDQNIISISAASKIVYNTVFEIAFICINNTLLDDYEIEIELNNTIGKDNDYFTRIDYNIENTYHLFGKQKISSAGGLLNKYYFKSNRFRPFLILPVFHVIIRRNQKIITEFDSPVKQVQNQWIGKTILIGKQYRTMIRNLEEKVLDNDQFSCFLAYGTSGTGKTRILKETLDILLKHRYRIVNFIGNEEDSAYILLKELIYFVYEVPRDDILKGLENDIFTISQTSKLSNAQQAYYMAQRFSKAKSDSELIEIIEDCFDVLYEKIGKEHIAIIIDNIQFFGDALIYFLQKFIMYSKHQTRTNSSVLIISINEDYITEKTDALLKYIKSISEDSPHFCCYNITGFRNTNQGIMFLRELMHISDDSLDEEFKIILKKTTLKPYYIYQAVYYLYEKEAISEADDEKGYFPCMEKFCDAIVKMPSKINDILNERWSVFLQNNHYDETEVTAIIASVYLFRELTTDLIQLFNLSTNIINLLTKRMFLRINENENYCFDHDIIENFFVSKYPDMPILVIDDIRKHRAGRKLSKYPFVNLYYQLWNPRMDTQKLQHIYEQTLVNSIPLKLTRIYYEKFLNTVLKCQKKYVLQEEWMNIVFNICNLSKNSVGIIHSQNLFKTVNSYLTEIKFSEILFTSAFRNYLNIYSDTLFFQKRFRNAIVYLEKIKKIIPNIESDQTNALKAMINNRLMINYRELPSEYYKKMARNSLSESKLAVDKIKQTKLKDEFTFLNISDEGYFYYCLYSQREKLISIWNQCIEYPPDRLPQKAMNYYRKQIQLELIRQNFHKVMDIISEGQEYMEIHYSGNMEKLIFKLSFSIYTIIAYIQDDPVKNKSLLQTEISYATEKSYLLAKRNFQQLLILNAIVCYYNNNVSGTYYHYKEAYIIYSHDLGARFYEEKKKLLLSNIYISFQKFHMFNRAKEFLKEDDLVVFNNLNINLSQYEAAGIQRTSDKLFNLPAV